MKINSAADLLSKARLQLLMHYPFFGHLAMYLHFVPSETAGVGTTCVDGKGNMYYNPKWVEKYTSIDEAIFELAHEVMHIVQRASSRFPAGGNHKVWNAACDIKVDSLLEESGLTRSSISQKNITKEMITKFKDHTTEQIYYLLLNNPQMMQKMSQSGSGESDPGNDSSENNSNGGNSGEPKGDPSQAAGERKCICGALVQQTSDIEDLENWKSKIFSAIQIAEAKKGKGNLPGFLSEFIADLTAPTITWKDIIRRHATETFKGRTSFRRPNRRTHAINMRLPAREPSKKGAIIAIDTSGSISAKELNQALSECAGMLRGTGCKTLSLYFHDVECYRWEEYNINSLKNVKIKQGGTSHVDVFKKIEENERNIGLVVAFTDLETSFPTIKPDYQVLWVHAKGTASHITPPWGKKVEMELN